MSIDSISNEVPIHDEYSLQKSSCTVVKTPMLKKYGMLIQLFLETNTDLYSNSKTKMKMKQVEVYFDSIMNREDWLGCILRYSLPETIRTDIYDGDDIDDQVFAELPNLFSVPDYELLPLLWRKLRICSSHLDLTDDRFNREIRIRYDTIQELIDVCMDGNGDLFNSAGSLEDCLRMLAHVLFRPLPVPDKIEYNALDMEMPFLDPNWDYIELVHDFLLKLITCSQIRIDCLRQVLSDSFDARERSIVRLVVHNLYGRLPRRRALFRRVFYEILWNVMTLNDRVTGVDDILTVYSSIVCGFAFPIKDEHIHFLMHCLLPLHKMERFLEFSSVLTRCLQLFVSRDHQLCIPIVKGVLRYWPRANTQREILLLDEIEKILVSSDSVRIIPIRTTLIQQLKRCIMSDQYLVAERTLKLWDNEEFAKLLLYDNSNREFSWELLSTTLHKVADGCWNTQVRKDANHVMELYLAANEV